MTETTNNSGILINGNIESSLKATFQETIYELVRQKQSFLSSTPTVITKPFDGRVIAITRAGSVNLKEVTERNQKRNYETYAFDRRWAKKKSWTNAFIMDRADVKDAIADPSSALYNAVVAAVNRLKDKVIVDAAVGNIKIGSGEEELITKTAEEDGVIEVDATSAYNYSILKKIENL